MIDQYLDKAKNDNTLKYTSQMKPIIETSSENNTMHSNDTLIHNSQTPCSSKDYHIPIEVDTHNPDTLDLHDGNINPQSNPFDLPGPEFTEVTRPKNRRDNNPRLFKINIIPDSPKMFVCSIFMTKWNNCNNSKARAIHEDKSFKKINIPIIVYADNANLSAAKTALKEVQFNLSSNPAHKFKFEQVDSDSTNDKSNTCVGCIENVPMYFEVSQFEKVLKNVQKIERNLNVKGLPTNSIKVTFNCSDLPSSCVVDQEIFYIKRFNFKTQKCAHCHKFNSHVSKNCPRIHNPICGFCSKLHKSEVCYNRIQEAKAKNPEANINDAIPGGLKCPNCNNNHSAGYGGCSALKDAETNCKLRDLKFQANLISKEPNYPLANLSKRYNITPTNNLSELQLSLSHFPALKKEVFLHEDKNLDNSDRIRLNKHYNPRKQRSNNNRSWARTVAESSKPNQSNPNNNQNFNDNNYAWTENINNPPPNQTANNWSGVDIETRNYQPNSSAMTEQYQSVPQTNFVNNSYDNPATFNQSYVQNHPVIDMHYSNLTPPTQFNSFGTYPSYHSTNYIPAQYTHPNYPHTYYGTAALASVASHPPAPAHLANLHQSDTMHNMNANVSTFINQDESTTVNNTNSASHPDSTNTPAPNADVPSIPIPTNNSSTNSNQAQSIHRTVASLDKSPTKTQKNTPIKPTPSKAVPINPHTPEQKNLNSNSTLSNSDYTSSPAEGIEADCDKILSNMAAFIKSACKSIKKKNPIIYEEKNFDLMLEMMDSIMCVINKNNDNISTSH